MIKHKLLLTKVLLLIAFISTAQTLTGVYAGAQLYTTPFDGMQVNHIVYYFRNDGSFSDDLSRKDWKTNVAGNYSVKQNVVHINFKDGKEAVRYQLAADGRLESTSGIKHSLRKVKKVTSLPAATYVKRTASSRGGMGTGMPTVGTASSDYFSLDGKGHFTLEHIGTTGVAGGGMAGKFGKNDKTSGTYTLGDGEITLSFRNGTVTKQAFFYSPPDEEDLILLNGVFYFREEEDEQAVPDEQVTSTKEDKAMPTATDLLGKLRSRYGGNQIDKMTTVKETATINSNLQAVLFTDITNKRVRIELQKGDQQLLVKQLEGNDGWQWMNGKKTTLSAADKKELGISLYQGILGLHQKLNHYFLTATVTKPDGDYMLTFSVNGTKVVYLIGDDYTMKGNAYAVSETPSISVYKNFTTKNGITYPSITESKTGNQTITATTTSIEINPVFTTDTWKMP